MGAEVLASQDVLRSRVRPVCVGINVLRVVARVVRVSKNATIASIV
jgi:hypothetical protein